MLVQSRLRILLLLAWPIVLARSTQAIIGFSDALMTAPLGESALAAVTTGALNTFTMVILPMGIVFIVQSFAAQLAGRDDEASARRYAWYGLALAAASGAVALAVIPVIAPALSLFRFESEVRALIAGYMAVRLTSVAAVVGTEALGNWYGGLGNTRIHMMAAAVTMVANIALNWVFIYGNLGAPAMGVDGAALASSLASWVGFAIIMLWFARAWGGSPPPVQPLGLRMSELWRMLRFGLPNGINWLLEFSAFMLFINIVMGSLGTVSLAALNVVIQINSVSFMPAFGLASAGAILVGQAVGGGNKGSVWPIVRTTLFVAVAWMLAIGVVYVSLPHQIITLFAREGDEGADLRAVGATMLALSAIWQIFDATSMTLGEALRAAGDTSWIMWARVILAWFVFLPVATLTTLTFDGGTIAAMLCLAGYLALLALALAFRFFSGAWRRIDLLGDAPVV